MLRAANNPMVDVFAESGMNGPFLGVVNVLEELCSPDGAELTPLRYGPRAPFAIHAAARGTGQWVVGRASGTGSDRQRGSSLSRTGLALERHGAPGDARVTRFEETAGKESVGARWVAEPTTRPSTGWTGRPRTYCLRSSSAPVPTERLRCGRGEGDR